MLRPPEGLRLCAFLSLALSALPGTAKASDDVPGDSSDPPSVVPIRIQSLPEGDTAAVEKYARRRQPAEVVAQCSEDCERTLPPGNYRVRLYDASWHEVSSTRVSLAWPTTLTASQPESRSLGKWGLGMGIVGSAATIVGAGLLLLSFLSQMDDPYSSPSQQQSLRDFQTAAGITTLTGLTLAVTGWALFAENHSAFHVSTEYPRVRGVSFGVAPTDHGVTTGVTLFF